MENIIDKLFSFFTSSDKNLGDRIFYGLILLYLSVFADYNFGFTKQLFISNKLNTLESITNLKTAYKNDSLKIKYLNTLETETFNSKHYLESSSNSAIRNPVNNIEQYIIIKEPSNIIICIFYLSCCLFLIIVLIFYFFCFLFYFKKLQFKEAFYFLTIVVIVKLIIDFNCYLLLKFPILLNNVMYNVIFNSALTYLETILLGRILLPISKKLSID